MGLAHITDWYATFATLGGVPAEAILDAVVDLPKTDSISLWEYINGGESESPRTEIVLDHHMFSEASGMNGTCGEIAIIRFRASQASNVRDWGAEQLGRFRLLFLASLRSERCVKATGN